MLIISKFNFIKIHKYFNRLKYLIIFNIVLITLQNPYSVKLHLFFILYIRNIFNSSIYFYTSYKQLSKKHFY